MKKHLYSLLILLFPVFVFTQDVGIGTSSPMAKLNILGDSSDPLIPGTSSKAILRISGDENYDALDIGKKSSGKFDAWLQAGSNGDADPISLNPLGGKVGIGLFSPSAELHVNGDLKVAGIISGVSDPIHEQDAATKAYVDLLETTIIDLITPTYTIGLFPELGGYIFWVSADGKHGLVAETIDQGFESWYEAKNLISNPDNHSVDGENFRDWRMPTKYELNQMYLQEDDIGGFSGNYWSSTDGDYSVGWRQVFSNGDQGLLNKNLILNFRSVRAF